MKSQIWIAWFDFFQQTDSQVAGATNSIISLQNWPQGQIRRWREPPPWGWGKFLCGIFGCAPTIYMSVNDLTKKELCEIIEFVVGKVCCYVEEYGNLRTSMY